MEVNEVEDEEGSDSDADQDKDDSGSGSSDDEEEEDDEEDDNDDDDPPAEWTKLQLSFSLDTASLQLRHKEAGVLAESRNLQAHV